MRIHRILAVGTVAIAWAFVFAGELSAGVLGIPTAEGGLLEKILDLRNYPWYDPCQHGFDRAGDPDRIARWAESGYSPIYSGYEVGGGAALYGSPPTKLRGECRYDDEGTFGVDYDPPWSRVRLQWFHGARYQDGQGQYEPDRRNNPLRKFFSGR